MHSRYIGTLDCSTVSKYLLLSVSNGHKSSSLFSTFFMTHTTHNTHAQHTTLTYKTQNTTHKYCIFTSGIFGFYYINSFISDKENVFKNRKKLHYKHPVAPISWTCQWLNSRMSGATPPLHPYALMAWTGAALNLLSFWSYFVIYALGLH